ncbi:MAG: alkaline phosphatase family protein [Clostridia bacterium]|nr:alkaline phosphatase family protein [Clostridia bacterium]
MKKGFKILLAIVIAVVVATAVVVPSVHYTRFAVPKEMKADRVSQGVVPTAAQVAAAPKYDRVVIFGVDGAGGALATVDTPAFDRIFGEGSVNCHGTSQYPTISAQNWAAMLLGVTAQTHQITNDKANLFTRKVGGALPSVFATVSAAMPQATFFSAVDWSNINHGIIEKDIAGMTKVNAKTLVKDPDDEEKVDEVVADKAVERLQTHDDTIVFLHFDAVDHAGHMHGNASAEYVEAIRWVDEQMGRVYDAYRAKGLVDTTLFICVTDHGHTEKGGHGKESPSEKAVTLAVAGGLGNVIKGTSGTYVTHDLAPIVLYALGVAQPAHYEGGVPRNLFVGLE